MCRDKCFLKSQKRAGITQRDATLRNSLRASGLHIHRILRQKHIALENLVGCTFVNCNRA
jgi:hypothetical protein